MLHLHEPRAVEEPRSSQFSIGMTINAATAIAAVRGGKASKPPRTNAGCGVRQFSANNSPPASARLSLDAAPRNVDLVAIEQWLLKQPGAQGLHDLHAGAMSTTPERAHRPSCCARRRTRLRHAFDLARTAITVRDSAHHHSGRNDSKPLLLRLPCESDTQPGRIAPPLI